MNSPDKTILFIVNVGWYFKLHWLDRVISIKNYGYDVIIMCNWRCDYDLVKMVEGLGIKCIHMNLDRRRMSLMSEISSFLAVFREILRLRPQIIHGVTVKPNLYGGLAASFLGIPFVASITGLGTVFSSNSLEYVLAKMYILFWYRVVGLFPSNRFIFENNDDLDYFVSSRILPRIRTVKINGAGVNISVFSPRPEPNTSCIKVLFAARLLKEKGLDHLVEAIGDMQNKGYNIIALVAGIHDEVDPDSLPVSLIKIWEKQGFVKWLGSCSDMYNVINDSHIVCLPTSYAEGIPRILIEGASCARPLVAPDLPGCNEIVENGTNGLLYSRTGRPTLADCLTTLANDPLLRQSMGFVGRQKIINHYSHEKVVDTMLGVYSSLIIKRLSV